MPTGYCIGVAGPDHRRGRLEEHHRRLGEVDLAAHLLRVLGVVAPDRDDLARQHRREQPHVGRRHRVADDRERRERVPLDPPDGQAADRSPSAASPSTTPNAAPSPVVNLAIRTRRGYPARYDARARVAAGPRPAGMLRPWSPTPLPSRRRSPIRWRSARRRHRRAARDGAGGLLLRRLRPARARPVAVPDVGALPRPAGGSPSCWPGAAPSPCSWCPSSAAVAWWSIISLGEAVLAAGPARRDQVGRRRGAAAGRRSRRRAAPPRRPR